ncbi:cation:proton antiporter [Paracoccus sp. TK19116]|uniref:Cation:proton antiporter n=1 Tax=Paracoccus albicereus TaxID=2922394 RepID=A0ABT1MPU2_9RHOB|nr:cation:proton antiporter [Paracoccus albicereus]MCQ0970333.1 cation:proton antiporter [Paracoccus albicereus]
MSYELFLVFLGFGVLAAAVVPALMRRLGMDWPVSLPMSCLFGGILVGTIVPGMPHLDPIDHAVLIEKVTEFAVILSLTGCGLKLDRPIDWRGWSSTSRLLVVAMPLSIFGLVAAGWGILELPLAAALLLGAVMAPTDPVLAASVQVGPPGESQEEETRFALTSEAGLNDGLAFPFVYLAIAAAADRESETGQPGDAGSFDRSVLIDWLAVDVVWKIAAGVLMGWLIGKVLAWLVFRAAPTKTVKDAFLALGITLFAYGAAELVHGYGFIAVFIAALTFRRFEHDHRYHADLHHFIEQTEMLFLILVIFVTGIAIAQGLLAPMGLRGLLVAMLFLVVIRPVAAWISLNGLKMARDERFAISILGVRGVGSIYYLAYGLAHAPFSMEAGRVLWGIVALIMAISVVAHGMLSPKVMSRLSSRR